MELILKQVSSLEKIRPGGIGTVDGLEEALVLGGQSFSYQIALQTPDRVELSARVESPVADWVKLHNVVNVVMDVACYSSADDDYITKEPGIMPDMLLPLEGKDALVHLTNQAGALWVQVQVPENTPAGRYPITVKLHAATLKEEMDAETTLVLEVLGQNLPAQKTRFTQWFYVDCIADVHKTPIYSEEHWALIEKYIALARSLGLTMLLTPVITPPLDTAVGTHRPNVQLVKMEKKGDTYHFDFTLLQRWVALCQKYGFREFEMSHLFSQWGLSATPNIWVTEDGEEKLMFGWHVPAKSEAYRDFLGQFLPALIAWLKEKGIKEHTWFHISDEPHAEHIENYSYAKELIVPLIDGCTTMDALSDYDFYERGLVEIPVTKNDRIEPFLAHKLPRQWVYYCCSQNQLVGNRYLAQPSYRNRILGLQIYKFGCEGFLHWGFNFYNSRRSLKNINPFMYTGGDQGFPSGDPFSVYPVEGGVVPSLRAVIFREALADIEICRLLESYIGKEAVVAMIDEAAGEPLTFSCYPRNSRYIPDLIRAMLQRIAQHQ
ncbi:MAG: DUF4091 domain-containing protein [Oscillospiraceae bacterium]|nr:DUF4091 domain-containing protein [Oscillospiraceae bacterium]